MRGKRGASDMTVIVVILALLVAGGATIFFLATPKGRQVIASFLAWAAGKPSEPEVVEPKIDAEALMFLERAKVALARNDLDGAEVAARAALTREPEYEEAKKLLADIENRKAVAEEIRRKTVHDQALASARQFLAAGDLEQAGNFVRRALEASPESPEAKELRQKIAQERARLAAEAAKNAEKVEALVLAGITALASGDWQKALGFAEEALALNARSTSARLLKSQAELERRRAAGQESQSDKEKRAEADRYFEIAKISWSAGDAEGTESFAKKALSVWPTHEGAKFLLEKAIAARMAAIDKGEIPAEVQQVLKVLEELDGSIEREDAAALKALLSPSAEAGVLVGVSATRAEELENAAEFFRIASNISYERTTDPKAVRVGGEFADVRSDYRVSYSIDEASISRFFSASYNLVREGGAWRIRSVVVNAERP